MTEINMAHFPEVVLEKILSFLTFDEIAKNRRVCLKFNVCCKSMLNRGFLAAERRRVLVTRRLKSCLPRRESERRSHPLARHCEILSALETRISMLSMTFKKFIEGKQCCFIPGRIIDEILHILNTVQSNSTPPRTYDLLQELRDISSMAMEHFEEKIAPGLHIDTINTKKCYSDPAYNLAKRLGRHIMPEFLRREFKTINQHSRSHRQQVTKLKRVMAKIWVKVKRQSKVTAYHTYKLREQKRLIQDQVSNIAELKKNLEEWDLKFADLTNELTQQTKSESKASQTHFADTSTEPFDILANPAVPPLTLRFDASILDIPAKSVSTSILNTNTSIFDIPDALREFESNIRPRRTYKYKPSKHVSASNYWESLSTSRNYFQRPNIRPSISSLRTATSKQSEVFPKDQIQKTDRKRKVIDLIANVVHNKQPKIEDTSDKSKIY